MSDDNKRSIELNQINYSDYDHLSRNDKKRIEDMTQYLKKLSNLISLLGVLIVLTLFIDQFTYSAYVLLIIALLAGVISIYIHHNKKKTRQLIATILYPSISQSEKVKVNIHVDKNLDTLDKLSSIFIASWSVIYLIWSIYRIIHGVF